MHKRLKLKEYLGKAKLRANLPTRGRRHTTTKGRPHLLGNESLQFENGKTKGVKSKTNATKRAPYKSSPNASGLFSL